MLVLYQPDSEETNNRTTKHNNKQKKPWKSQRNILCWLTWRSPIMDSEREEEGDEIIRHGLWRL